MRTFHYPIPGFNECRGTICREGGQAVDSTVFVVHRGILRLAKDA